MTPRFLFPVLPTLLLTLASCGSEEVSSCTVAENGDGSATISCDDGSSVTLNNGEDGPAGQNGVDGLPGALGADGETGQDGEAGPAGDDGAEGTDGTDCDLSDNGNGTSTVTCGTESVTFVTCSIGDTQCADASSLDVCEADIGFAASEDCGAGMCQQDLGQCEIPFGAIRLSSKASNTLPYQSWNGRLEVFSGGEWGTVCHNRFNQPETAVACRQLGSSTGSAFRGTAFSDTSTAPIFLGFLGCTGEEDRLVDCRTAVPFGATGCTHASDIEINCDPQEGDLLIVGGTAQGRLEVIYNSGDSGSVQATVCDDLFDDVDAGVACRQLGFDGGTAMSNLNTPDGSGNIAMDDLLCLGDEARLEDCLPNPLGAHNCQHSEDAGVSCFYN
ncbi:MAG: hypothetical protein ACJATT_004376 [Myxococcota bacterium]|jgi:hypothetical protein